jgi:eukaryotic-like serine/threonine-protein kinase
MLVPETILQGRYRVVHQLGQGGMGTVYEAIDERLDTTVALKETLFTDERLRKQFEREARLLARMHHPALPRVSDHFSENSGQFLVMQFIAGDDMSEMLAHRRGSFPSEQVLTWADQLLDALDYLHTQEPPIIHRDIKPQNLKLTARGQVILLDFGLAKGQVSEISRVTTSASIFGYTPNYAPLEQVQGLGTDVRSDIYSLSATLYHLITGIKPQDALTRAAAIVNGADDPLLPANEVQQTVSPQVAAVLQRGMSQNREQRFTSAAEMRKSLGGLEQGATVLNRTEADTVLFMPTEAPVLAAKTTPQAGRKTAITGETTVVRPPAVQSGRRASKWAIAAIVAVIGFVGVGVFYAIQRRAGSEVSPAVNLPNSTPTDTIQGPTPEPQQAAQSEDQNAVANETKKPEPQSEQIATKQKAKVVQEKAAATTEPSPPEVDHESKGAEVVVPEPEQIEPNVPSPPVRLHRRPDGVTVRTLPDGTQLISSPEGTIVVNPDGTRRVFRRGGRAMRRRN